MGTSSFCDRERNMDGFKAADVRRLLSSSHLHHQSRQNLSKVPLDWIYFQQLGWEQEKQNNKMVPAVKRGINGLKHVKRVSQLELNQSFCSNKDMKLVIWVSELSNWSEQDCDSKVGGSDSLMSYKRRQHRSENEDYLSVILALGFKLLQWSCSVSTSKRLFVLGSSQSQCVKTPPCSVNLHWVNKGLEERKNKQN